MSTGSLTQIRPAEVPPLVESGAVLIDVREHQEITAGHAPGAMMNPLQAFDLGKVPTDAPVILICRSGARSMAAANALANMGFTTYNVQGGMAAWQRDGLPVVADDGSQGMVL
ncbi:MAG: rhodanese-like domain-containing protein [Actinomycetales bacterium]|nr:rhodanese-like domain-containing protein [Actinomycetales bacterium]